MRRALEVGPGRRPRFIPSDAALAGAPRMGETEMEAAGCTHCQCVKGSYRGPS